MKRRFTKAMLELGNSQASCAARRLVGQTIRAVEKRGRAAQRRSIGSPPPPPNQKIQHQQQQRRRQFRYTFAPANHAGQHNGPSSGEFLAFGGGQSSSAEHRLESGRQDHGRASQTQTGQRQAKASGSRPGKLSRLNRRRFFSPPPPPLLACFRRRLGQEEKELENGNGSAAPARGSPSASRSARNRIASQIDTLNDSENESRRSSTTSADCVRWARGGKYVAAVIGRLPIWPPPGSRAGGVIICIGVRERRPLE